jgi:hypothetical protein
MKDGVGVLVEDKLVWAFKLIFSAMKNHISLYFLFYLNSDCFLC